MRILDVLKFPATAVLTALLILSETGCSVFEGPEDVKALTEEYQTIQGTLVAPPVLEDGGRRLFIYIQREKPTNGTKEVLVCVTVNKDNKDVLKRLSKNVVSGTEQPIFIYARPVNGKWNEFMEGVDYEMIAVGYYNKDAGRYMTAITTYGDSLTDALKNVGWQQFLIDVGKMAIKGAI